jgi:hypothetical protein
LVFSWNEPNTFFSPKRSNIEICDISLGYLHMAAAVSEWIMNWKGCGRWCQVLSQHHKHILPCTRLQTHTAPTASESHWRALGYCETQFTFPALRPAKWRLLQHQFVISCSKQEGGFLWPPGLTLPRNLVPALGPSGLLHNTISFRGVWRPQRETNLLIPSNTTIENTWSHASTLSTPFNVMERYFTLSLFIRQTAVFVTCAS